MRERERVERDGRKEETWEKCSGIERVRQREARGTDRERRGEQTEREREKEISGGGRKRKKSSSEIVGGKWWKNLGKT